MPSAELSLCRRPAPGRSHPIRRCMALPARSARPGIRRGSAGRNARRRSWRTGSGTRSSHVGRSTRSRARTGQGPKPHRDRARAYRPSDGRPLLRTARSQPRGPETRRCIWKAGQTRQSRQAPATSVASSVSSSLAKAQTNSAAASTSGASGVAVMVSMLVIRVRLKNRLAVAPAASRLQSMAPARHTAQLAASRKQHRHDAHAQVRVSEQQRAESDRKGDDRRMIVIAGRQMFGPKPVIGLVERQGQCRGHDQAQRDKRRNRKRDAARSSEGARQP